MTREYDVFAALHEETSSPWVWLSSATLKSRAIIRVCNERTRRTTWCECRIIDPNFIKLYNSDPSRREILDGLSALVISDWYRDKLGIKGTGERERVRLEIVLSNNWYAELGLYRHHPDRTVRLAASLGILSVLLTLILGALSMFFRRLG